MIPPRDTAADAGLGARLQIKAELRGKELDVTVEKAITDAEAGQVLRAYGLSVHDDAIVKHPAGYVARGYLGEQTITARISYARESI